MRMTGADARTVLQGQTTADFERARPGEHLFAIFCNPKGRVIADTLALVASEDTVFLRGRIPVMTQLANHLKPYLAFSKSTLEDTGWIVSCDRLKDQAEQAEGAQLSRHADVIIGAQVNRGHGFVEHWRSPEHEAPAASAALLSLAEVDLHTARARIEIETIGAYLVQDLDYDLNGSVSFSKGCYTGQEIIARLHYRGTPKRRLHRAVVRGSSEHLPPGIPLVDEQGKTVGSLVNAVALSSDLGALIELIPAAAAEKVLIKGQSAHLSAIEACHSASDQSTG